MAKSLFEEGASNNSAMFSRLDAILGAVKAVELAQQRLEEQAKKEVEARKRLEDHIIKAQQKDAEKAEKQAERARKDEEKYLKQLEREEEKAKKDEEREKKAAQREVDAEKRAEVAKQRAEERAKKWEEQKAVYNQLSEDMDSLKDTINSLKMTIGEVGTQIQALQESMNTQNANGQGSSYNVDPAQRGALSNPGMAQYMSQWGNSGGIKK